MNIESPSEFWFAEYQLQHGDVTKNFLCEVPRNSAEEAVAAFHRLSFDRTQATLIGPVKFVREVVESAPKPDDDGWIPHTPGDPMPVDGKVRVIVGFADGGRSPLDTDAEYWGWGSGHSTANVIAYKLA